MFRMKRFLVCAKERLIFQFWQGQELRNPRVSDFGETRNTSALGKINGKKVLCFRGKEVLKMSEFDKVIESEFLHCKGVGSRKLKQQLAMRYEGVSEPRVQKILSKSSLNQMVNAKFGNKAISRPIRASGVQVRKYFTALIPWNIQRVTFFFLVYIYMA